MVYDQGKDGITGWRGGTTMISMGKKDYTAGRDGHDTGNFSAVFTVEEKYCIRCAVLLLRFWDTKASL